ncbi:MAG: signal peptidase I [Bacilli bacterium]|nr:signal peptidase I [Bacilli bacterium]
MKGVVRKAFDIIKSFIILILIVMLAVVILQRATKNSITIGDFYIFQVASGSMEPEYKVGDLIVVRKSDSSTYKVGDDLTYKTDENGYHKGIIITHRLIRIENNDGKYSFVTQGIANDVEDPKISEDNVYGKVVCHCIVLSFLGRLMQHNVAYYVIFVVGGLLLAYDLLIGFFIKESDDDEDSKEEK